MKLRKTLSLLLAAALLAACLPLTASAVDVSVGFSGADLVLSDSIGIRFYANKAAVTSARKYVGSYATLSFDVNRDGTPETVTIEPEEVNVGGTDFFRYTFVGIAPDKMGETVTAQLHIRRSDDQIGDGQTVSYSVKDYVLSMMGDATLDRLLADLIAYGKAAEAYTGEGTLPSSGSEADALNALVAASAHTEEVANTAASNARRHYYAAGVTATTAKMRFTSVGLNLRDNAAILYAFAPASGEDIADYSLKVTVDDTTYTYGADAFEENAGTYLFRFRELLPTQMKTVVRAWFVDGSGATVSANLCYSVETYAYQCWKNRASNLPLYNLTQAMLRYGWIVANNGSSFDVSRDGFLQVYPEYDARIERDYVYDVAVTQGSESRRLTCYNHCDAVASSDRTVNGDAVRRFCEFAFADAAVRVDITVKQDFDSYTVMPSAKGFQSERHDNVISVYLPEPDYFLLKLDDKDDSILSVFADAPETDVPQKGAANVLYVEGWYQPDNWHLDITQNNYTVYLAPGSVLNARLCVTGQNVTVKGRGILLDPFSNIYEQDVSVDRKVGSDNCRFFHIKNAGCTVDGIKMIDARDFNLFAMAGGLTCTNFKVLSSEMCTDGITQAGDNNSYEHCFIYCGDNGIVISGGKNQKYKDITIGTICCGIFPQLAVGEIDMEDVYIFRADEGLMRNIYNPNGTARSFDIKFTNVSCVDCDHFPFIFVYGNMGSLSKTITFKNLAVPVATGSNSIRTPSATAATIQKYNGSNYDSSNYHLIFDGLSIGGQAVTNASAIVRASDVGSDVTITVQGNGATWPALPATVTGSVKAPGKIFIGNRQLFLKNGAVQQNGAWYVPAADVCKALACAVPSDTVTVNGEAYVSLAALVSGGCTTSATYDSGAKAVRIAAVDRGDNLLAWGGNEAHCRWSELVCYETHLLYIKNAGGDYFYNKDSSVGSGACYMLTEQVNQYGRGTYTLTVDMKADVACSCRIRFKLNTSNTDRTVSLTTSWKTFTLTFTATKDQVNNAALAIMTQLQNAGVAFRNPVLTHSN